jgi:hypothetical protein
MSPRYLKSETDALPFDLKSAVEKYASDLQAFRENPVGDPPLPPHPMVSAAVRIDDHTYVIDYEIVDDTPPAPTLAQRKLMVTWNIDLAHAAAEAAVMSPARRQLLSMDAVDASGKTDATSRDLMAALTALNAKSRENARHAALLKIEVEDLTDVTIDSWQVTPFPHGAVEG